MHSISTRDLDLIIGPDSSLKKVLTAIATHKRLRGLRVLNNLDDCRPRDVDVGYLTHQLLEEVEQHGSHLEYLSYVPRSASDADVAHPDGLWLLYVQRTLNTGDWNFVTQSYLIDHLPEGELMY
ncbi:unnamed protein product [Periconia digitata]|uniref:Uncharacterized protein n=1 Tax=Periconia digitata TaxID=1303443 RepID=A0A9W4UAA9_9PLEO|nr:unnamed protein product [Periconia digitata]